MRIPFPRPGRGLFAVAGATLLALALPALAAPPDLTGVWTNPPGVRDRRDATGRPQTPPLPPFTPEAARRVAAYKALVGPGGETPGQYCLGHGMPGAVMGGGGYPMEIIQRPEQITIIYELHGETRRVYFGERNAPEADRIPGRGGYSSGRWEGDTLVIETDNLSEIIDERYPHSDQARIVERYTIAGNDEQDRRILEVELTMTDPTFYQGPVKLTRRWMEIPNGRLLPYECNEEIWQARLEELAGKAGVPLP